MSKIEEIISALEKATGPDRELDGLIYGSVNNLRRNGGTFMLDIDGERFQFEHPTLKHPNGPGALYVRGYNVGEYTASIDAAMTLVPEGYSRSQRTAEHHENGFVVELWPSWGPQAYRRIIVPHHVEAIALCIASLKARASLTKPTPVPKWLNGEPYYCSYCGAGGSEYMGCEDVRCSLESPAVAQARRAASLTKDGDRS